MSGRIGELFVCDMCGEKKQRTRINQKYCDECGENQHSKPQSEAKTRNELNAEYRQRWYAKPEAKVIEKPKYNLAEVNQAARKHNMSYGQYVAAWKQGQVEEPEKIPEKKKKRGRKKK